MLVLNVEKGESIFFQSPDGEQVGQVKRLSSSKFGFDFPREIKILRESLLSKEGKDGEKQQ